MAAVTTALVIGGAAAAAAVGVGAGIGLGVLVGVGVAGLTFATGALNPEIPKTGTATTQRAREQTVTTDLPAQDRRIIYGKTRVGGIVAYKTVEVLSNIKYLYFVVTWCDGPVESIDELFVQGKKLTLNQQNEDIDQFEVGNLPYIKAESRLGNAGQSPVDWAVNEISDWTPDHPGLGVCYTIFRFRKDTRSADNLFPSGISDLQAVIRGRNDIYDPRIDQARYTANNALCLAHYLSLPKLGANVNFDSINSAELIASANNCDEQVALKAGGFEARYECNGAISLKDSGEDIIALFVENMAGHFAQIGGRYILRSGYYVAPDAGYTLDSAKIVNPTVKYRTKPKWRERYNTVRGIFIGEISNWQPADFPAYRNAAYLTEDGDREQAIDLELPLCSSHSQAQRLAKIKLERVRRSKTVQVVADCSLFRKKVFDTVVFDSGRHPVFDGLNYRIEQIGLAVNDDNTLSVSTVLRETTPEIFNWDEQTDEKDIQVDLINSSDLTGTVIENFTATPLTEFATLADGTVKASILLTWNNPDTSEYYESNIYFRKVTDPISQFVLIPGFQSVLTTEYRLDGLEPDTEYDFFVESFRQYFGTIKGLNGPFVIKIGSLSLFNQSTAVWDGGIALPTVATPTVDNPGGDYPTANFPISVAISVSTGGATIRWSKSTMPNSETEGTEYTAPVDVADGETIFAKAFLSNYQPSNGIAETYTAV